MTDERLSGLLQAIKQCADTAAERGVEISVEVDDFGFEGHFKATITATPQEKKP